MPHVQVGGRTLEVAAGTRLSQALHAGEVPVETPCGARGRCRKCQVLVTEGAPPPTLADDEQLSAEELALGYRLSCQLVVQSDLRVAVLPTAAAVVDRAKAAMGRLSGPVAVEPWAPLRASGRSVGFALDVGTTSLAGALLDLRSGEELAADSRPNPQAVHGADLMNRLAHATEGEENAYELQMLVLGAARQMLDRLCSKAGLARENVTQTVVVGNTAMHHLFLGLDVADLAVAPYRPTVLDGYEAVLPGLPPVYALPNIAGFVGADAVAAALAVGLDQPAGNRLLVDIGTNGEILLATGEAVYCCSAPAGPAFEGGEISQGMRAGPGAIEAVSFDGAGLQVQTVGGAPARGICGSGLLDAVAALRAAGRMDWQGRLAGGAVAATLAPGVAMTQKDVRALQLAKGAIRSGADLLLQVAGLRPADLDEVLLAGAFGNYLRVESALAIGLLPPVPVERVRPVGNAAAAGARLALLSASARNRAERLARVVRPVDLATHPDFEQIFLDALNLPR